jgi:hypothetical protein
LYCLGLSLSTNGIFYMKLYTNLNGVYLVAGCMVVLYTYAVYGTNSSHVLCMAMAQGGNIVSALGSTSQYSGKKCMPLRQKC